MQSAEKTRVHRQTRMTELLRQVEDRLSGFNKLINRPPKRGNALPKRLPNMLRDLGRVLGPLRDLLCVVHDPVSQELLRPRLKRHATSAIIEKRNAACVAEVHSLAVFGYGRCEGRAPSQDSNHKYDTMGRVTLRRGPLPARADSRVRHGAKMASARHRHSQCNPTCATRHKHKHNRHRDLTLERLIARRCREKQAHMHANGSAPMRTQSKRQDNNAQTWVGRYGERSRRTPIAPGRACRPALPRVWRARRAPGDTRVMRQLARDPADSDEWARARSIAGKRTIIHAQVRLRRAQRSKASDGRL